MAGWQVGARGNVPRLVESDDVILSLPIFGKILITSARLLSPEELLLLLLISIYLYSLCQI